MSRSPILVPWRNCWRRERAGRAAFLVDAAAYFNAVAGAIERAEHSVFILGWDLHSRVRLRRDDKHRDWPDELVALLNTAVERNRKLRIYILEWDFYVIYAAERELLPLVRFGARTHRRVHFRLDDHYPTGGSQHQKIVVVDDAVAFSGGIDITACRWDTPEHAPGDPRRSDPGFTSYAPFHDVQMAVDGSAAAALGELARERWHRSGGRRVQLPPSTSDPWPADLKPDATGVDVAIARTEPEYDGREETREVERSYLDCIAAAQHSIYIENQYVTAYKVRDALAERLREEDGPEVVIVSPRTCSGWLEHSTMGSLREIFMHHLREVDRFDRVRFYYPTHRDGSDIFVHAKLMITDDRVARVGSANLANRSMGLDTECDLLLEADGDDSARAVAGFRNRLLAEHLGTTADDVDKAMREHGGLIAAIEALRGGSRTLEPIRPEETWLAEVISDRTIFDPERPVTFDQLEDMLSPEMPSEEDLRTIARPGLVLVVVLALAGVWALTPVGDWATPDRVAALAEPMRTHAAGPLLWTVVFVVAGVLMVPLSVLITASALLFGPFMGMATAAVGSLVSGVAGYFLGRWFWRDTVRRLAGERVNRISRQIGERGIASVVALRLMPIAPYTMVNLVAGASHVGVRDFVAGTIIGLTPGIVGLSILANRAVEAVTDPSVESVAMLAVVAVLLVGALYWLRRSFAGRVEGESDKSG